MNIAGGSRRIRNAGRYMVFAAAALFGTLACLLAVALLWPSLGIHFALIELIALPMLVAVPGGALWLVGWIVEGFADNAPESELRT